MNANLLIHFFLTDNNEFVILHNRKVRTYRQAKAICALRGMTLPLPRTKALNDELDRETNGVGEFYLGLDKKESNIFNWADGEIPSWGNWLTPHEKAYSSPDHAPGKDCATMVKSRVPDHTKAWEYVECMNETAGEKDVVCEHGGKIMFFGTFFTSYTP